QDLAGITADQRFLFVERDHVVETIGDRDLTRVGGRDVFRHLAMTTRDGEEQRDVPPCGQPKPSHLAPHTIPTSDACKSLWGLLIRMAAPSQVVREVSMASCRSRVRA